MLVRVNLLSRCNYIQNVRLLFEDSTNYYGNPEPWLMYTTARNIIHDYCIHVEAAALQHRALGDAVQKYCQDGREQRRCNLAAVARTSFGWSGASRMAEMVAPHSAAMAA